MKPNENRLYGGKYRLHRQGFKVNQARNQHDADIRLFAGFTLDYNSALKMEAMFCRLIFVGIQNTELFSMKPIPSPFLVVTLDSFLAAFRLHLVPVSSLSFFLFAQGR
jgi:hypothetical protein